MDINPGALKNTEQEISQQLFFGYSLHKARRDNNVDSSDDKDHKSNNDNAVELDDQKKNTM